MTSVIEKIALPSGRLIAGNDSPAYTRFWIAFLLTPHRVPSCAGLKKTVSFINVSISVKTFLCL
jgi:hypothetical protein